MLFDSIQKEKNHENKTDEERTRHHGGGICDPSGRIRRGRRHFRLHRTDGRLVHHRARGNCHTVASAISASTIGATRQNLPSRMGRQHPRRENGGFQYFCRTIHVHGPIITVARSSGKGSRRIAKQRLRFGRRRLQMTFRELDKESEK